MSEFAIAKVIAYMVFIALVAFAMFVVFTASIWCKHVPFTILTTNVH